MSVTTLYTPAARTKELAEALLLTSSPSSTSSSSSGSISGSVDDADIMMLDFDVEVDALLPSSACLIYRTGQAASHFWLNQRPSLDLITGNPDALSSAVFCFMKSFVCASGSSTVAIDNKIEQAMDLVKSHLMFAVREEVEVLKERIAELLDRINRLESENTILRSSASPETLAQIAQLETGFLSGNTSSDGNGTSGGLAAIGAGGTGGGVVSSVASNSNTATATNGTTTSLAP